jgi:glucose 1-dehydrogenase
LAEVETKSDSGSLQIAACASAHPDELDSLIDALGKMGVEAAPLIGDLQQPDVPERLVEQAVTRFGGLDALVSNAGIATPATLLSLTTDIWDRLFDINVRATWLLAKAAHPALAESRGSIVTIGSMSGMEPQPGMGAYSASKAAIIMLTRLMAQEWGGDGIRVNCVSPGLVLTPMTEKAYADADFKARREAMVPVGRIADPSSDIAGVVGFLLSEDAAYMTGQNVLADGGLTDSVLRFLPVRKS